MDDYVVLWGDDIDGYLIVGPFKGRVAAQHYLRTDPGAASGSVARLHAPAQEESVNEQASQV